MTTKKKVLFLITKATWGGAQRYVFDLATHLPSEEFEPAVAYGQKGKLADDLAAAGIETRQLPSLGRNVALVSDIKSFFEIIRCIRSARPDIIHLNSSKAAALGVLAARLCGTTKIIFTVHGWPFKEDRNVAARAIIYLISWFTAALSHSVIVVSEKDLSLAKKMPSIAHKVVYIPIGLNTSDALSRDDAWKQIQQKIPALSPAGMRIVTVAELTPNKGLRYAIRAMEELRSHGVRFSYTIIGTGEEHAELSALIQKSGLAHHVHLAGFIPDAASYLKVFDVFLLPSLKEGMPYVLLEAAENGLPIITTSAVDLKLLNCTIVPPRDAGAIAHALLEAKYKNPPEARDFYPLSTMMEKTLALY